MDMIENTGCADDCTHESHRRRAAIVQRGDVLRREPVAEGEPWHGIVLIGDHRASKALILSPEAAELIEPSIDYYRIETPWGPTAHVLGEGLELPR